MLFLVVIFLTSSCLTAQSQSTQPLRIAHISDMHYLSSSLVDDGEAYQNFVRSSGRNIVYMHQVLHDVLTDLKNENIDILLITGDMVQHGERQSHIDLISRLRPIQAQGTRIFVVPGNHDVNVPTARAFIGNTPTLVPSVSAEEFALLYADFGFAQAAQRDSHSLSYLAKLTDDVWLLALDTSRHAEFTTQSYSNGRLLPETLAWALDILETAKREDIIVFGMMHHNLLEHLPLQALFFPDRTVDQWQRITEQFADLGLRVVFTGHAHNHSVARSISFAGNTIYEIQTGSLAQYPFSYRIMELHDGELTIESRFITSIPQHPNLAATYRQSSEEFARRTIQNRLRALGFPMPELVQNILVNIAVEMKMQAMGGEGLMDDSMIRTIQRLSNLLGSEMDMEEMAREISPNNNNLVIEVR